jgi:Zn-dependent M28 family amino/carboxypeptidase
VERRAPAREVTALVDAVSADSYRATLEALVSFPTRHSLGPEFQAAGQAAADQLGALGYSTRLQTVTLPGGETRNVVADKVGTAPDAERRLVYLVAHLDSISTSGGVDATAPGADDNASGAAGVLELARVLAGTPMRHDLRLVLFGGEEQGLFGSQAHVAALTPADSPRITMVINMDMIGRLNTSPPSVLLEGGEVSRPVIHALAEAAHDHTSLRVLTSLNPFASDHVPFIDAGLPAVLTIEGADDQNVDEHTPRDTLVDLELSLAVEILRMNTGATAAALGVTVPIRTDG